MDFLNSVKIGQLLNDQKLDQKLYEAAKQNNAPLMMKLLDAGAKPHFVGDNNFTALHWSAVDGNDKMVELLLAKKANIDLKDSNGLTALLLATLRRHKSTVKLLCEKGADVSILNQNNNSPLHVASLYGYDEIVSLLLQYSDINLKGSNGFTALHYAVEKGNQSTVELLCKNGADVSILNKNNDSPLHLASWRGYDVMVSFLLQYSDINLKDSNGCTALLLATLRRHESTVKLLCEKGADASISDKKGLSPLHSASWMGCDVMVSFLLQYSDINLINLKDSCGDTVFHIAVEKGNKSVVKLLIQKNADVFIQNSAQQNPFQLSLLKNDKNIPFLFLSLLPKETIEKLMPNERYCRQIMKEFEDALLECRVNLKHIAFLSKKKEGNFFRALPSELLVNQLVYLNEIFPFWYVESFLQRDLNEGSQFYCKEEPMLCESKPQHDNKTEEPMICEEPEPQYNSEDEVMTEAPGYGRMIYGLLSEGVNFVGSYLPSFSHSSKRKRDDADNDNVDTNKKRHKHG